MAEIHNLIIIGSGPAGLTAGIYAARAELKPVILAGRTFGGQLMLTTEVENFPGFKDGIMGPQLMLSMVAQAEKFGATMLYQDVIKVEFDTENKETPVHKVISDGGEYLARTVIVATGAKPRKLGIPGEAEYWGKGVSSCATCDGAFYRDKVVAVVGGGDSAMEEATFLTRFAKKVYLLHRRDQFRASKIMQKRAEDNPKVEFMLNTVITEVLGEGNVSTQATAKEITTEVRELGVEEAKAGAANVLPLRAQGKVRGLKLQNVETKAESTLDVDGLFLAIGYIPETEIFKQYIDVNSDGYARPVERTMSKVAGVFIAGDVEDDHYRQAVTAAADGCKAALDAEKWLMAKYS